jgi:hypothetical protein
MVDQQKVVDNVKLIQIHLKIINRNNQIIKINIIFKKKPNTTG